MLANAGTEQQALLDAATLTWTPTGTGKADSNNEEGWTLLPNKQVLTVDTRNGTNSCSHFTNAASFISVLFRLFVVQPDVTLTELEYQCFPIVAGLYRALSVR